MGRAKYSLELRMAVVKHYLSSQDGTKRTADAFGIHKSEVSQWVAAYQKHGLDGITWKNGRYNFEFRLHVVRVVQSEFLPLREAAVRFNISDHKVVGRWSKAYEASGDQGLRNLRKGAKNPVKRVTGCKNVYMAKRQFDLSVRSWKRNAQGNKSTLRLPRLMQQCRELVLLHT